MVFEYKAKFEETLVPAFFAPRSFSTAQRLP